MGYINKPIIIEKPSERLLQAIQQGRERKQARLSQAKEIARNSIKIVL